MTDTRKHTSPAVDHAKAPNFSSSSNEDDMVDSDKEGDLALLVAPITKRHNQALQKQQRMKPGGTFKVKIKRFSNTKVILKLSTLSCLIMSGMGDCQTRVSLCCVILVTVAGNEKTVPLHPWWKPYIMKVPSKLALIGLLMYQLVCELENYYYYNYYYYYIYSHIFLDSRAQLCNYATLLVGR